MSEAVESTLRGGPLDGKVITRQAEELECELSHWLTEDFFEKLANVSELAKDRVFARDNLGGFMEWFFNELHARDAFAPGQTKHKKALYRVKDDPNVLEFVQYVD